MEKKMRIMVMLLTGMMMGLCGCGRQGETAQEEVGTKTEEEISVEESNALSSHATEESGVYRSITVNSSEAVTIVPDMAEVIYSVRTNHSTAAGCQQQNSESVSQVIDLLKELGVEEKSIQTSDFYMRPVYNYSGSTPRVTGYEATTTLTVSDLKIEGLGDLLAQSVSSGINTVESITYQASGYDQSYQEALAKAVNMAYEKAKVLAAASGASVGNVTYIQETSGYSQARYTDNASTGRFNAAQSMKMEALMDAAADIMPGEIEVAASVVVEYLLVD